MTERENFSVEPTVGVMCEPGSPPPPPPPAWQPPKGATVKVLHGSIDGPELVAIVTLEPGAEMRHVHPEHQEIIVAFSEGAVEVLEGDAEDMVYPFPWTIGAGRYHVVRNIGVTNVKYLSIMRRGELVTSSVVAKQLR